MFDESPYHLAIVGMSFSWFENRNPQARAMMFDDHEDIAFREPAKMAVVAVLVLLKVDGPYLIKGECLSTSLFEGRESRGNRCELEWLSKTCHWGLSFSGPFMCVDLSPSNEGITPTFG